MSDPEAPDAGSRPDADVGRRLAGMLAAVVAVGVAAQVTVPLPGTPVPQSLQTLAVVLVGAWLGPAVGATTLLLYVVVGALGLPVFAEGARGASHLTGATAGYLAGFIAAAGLVGWWRVRGWCASLGAALGGMVLAHAVILALGWLRLATLVGPAEAFAQGVSPFVVGGVLKSVAAALVTVLVIRSTPKSAAR